MSVERRCETCGSALADGQRYCLTCGERTGGRSTLLGELLRKQSKDAKPSPDRGPAEPPARPPTAGRIPLRLPSPWISALLVAVFVGFGVLMGHVNSDDARLSASSTPALKLLVHHSAARSPSAGSSAAGAEPPESSSEPTPSAEDSESTATTTQKQEPSKKSSGGAKGREKSETRAKPSLSEIKHVYLIVLDDEPYAADFGPESRAHYLAHTLEHEGLLLPHYDAIAHEQLPNGIALLSGQGPTAQTAADCPIYTALTPGTIGGDEQAQGSGCVYPEAVKTLPGQLAAKHLRWRAYVQGTDEGGATPPACSHPAAGAADPSVSSGAYETARNPFVYFESVLRSPDCAADDVGLSQLAGDLKKPASAAPSFSYIVPDRCQDGGPVACAAGAASGPGDLDGFLEKVVPEITASKAYKDGGLLAIVTDEAPGSGEFADSSSCCGQPAYPNYTSPQISHGGGTVGALLLSPLLAEPGTTDQEQFNHFELLRTIEDAFGLSHLGYAALPAVKSLSASVLKPAGKG